MVLTVNSAGSHTRQQRGFTLIELLVVFTLLALLLTIAVPRYLETAEASRVKVRDQNMATIRDALDKFKADQGRYPTKLEELVDKRYLRKIPMDPVTDSNEWTVVEDSARVDAGVFDIAAPNMVSINTGTVEPPVDLAPPPDRGDMPVPNGATQPTGGSSPTPIQRTRSP